jgi:3D (Asp-Asp-Asp) domain-containing protein
MTRALRQDGAPLGPSLCRPGDGARRLANLGKRLVLQSVVVGCVVLSAIGAKELSAWMGARLGGREGAFVRTAAGASRVDGSVVAARTGDVALGVHAAPSGDELLREFLEWSRASASGASTLAPRATVEEFHEDASMRWFDARPVRRDRVVWMLVTAYSPDERSCEGSADGLTATLHCVTTNASLLVAADPKVFPYGTPLSIPGYGLGVGSAPDEPAIVPVLDCGGAIKGYRLDLLFPTHEEAIAWGTRVVPVTVWAYADGRPRPNPRHLR